jgi:transposase
MDFSFIIGVDASKSWLDLAVYRLADRRLLAELRVDNTAQAIAGLEALLATQLPDEQWTLGATLLLIEQSGLYHEALAYGWLELGGRISVVPATHIGQAMGRNQQREKTDQADARRIGEYGTRFIDQLECWQAPPQALVLIQDLQALRDRLVKVRQLLQVPLQELKHSPARAESLKKTSALQAELLQTLQQTIKETERELRRAIHDDDHLSKLFRLITSVCGVGAVIGREILLLTQAFNRFSAEQVRDFSRFIGTLPQAHESGSSVRKRKRTPKRRGKSLKTLLTMGSMSAIRNDPQIKAFYERKAAEGKHHNVIINAVRNKLIARVFAVVRKGTMYEKNSPVYLQVT